MTQRMRILLVEDNAGDADLTKETLEEGNVEVAVTVAADGAEAIDHLLGTIAESPDATPHLILLDLNLPRMDGRQVMRMVKSHATLRRIPIVVLTSSDAERDIAKSYELGANCYVTKPVGLEAFQSIVRSVEDFWFNVVKLP